MKRFLDIFHNREDYDNLNFTISGYFFAMFFITHVMMEFVLIYLGMNTVAIYNIIPILLFPLCIYLNHRNKSRIAIILSICELTTFSTISVISGGWDLGFYLYFIATISLVYFTQTLRLRHKTVLTTMITLLVVAIKILSKDLVIQVESQVVSTIYILNLVGSIASVSMIYYYFDSQRLGLAEETEKTKKLVNDIEDILETNTSIANKVSTIADHFSESFNENLHSQSEMSVSSELVARSSKDNATSNNNIALKIHDFSEMLENLKESVIQINQSSKIALELNNKGNNHIEALNGKLSNNIERTQNLGKAVTDLQKRADEISVIIDVIKTITRQINLLALNASIEAASAGEHGKGFSVVADEVRKLAEQSSSATEEIENIINSVKTGVETANKNMDEVESVVSEQKELSDETRNRFMEIKEKIVSMTNEIDSASKDIQEISMYKEEIVSLVDDSSLASKQATEATEKIADSIKAQSESMQKANAELQQLITLAGQLNRK